jgi:hypothetical protein
MSPQSLLTHAIFPWICHWNLCCLEKPKLEIEVLFCCFYGSEDQTQGLAHAPTTELYHQPLEIEFKGIPV